MPSRETIGSRGRGPLGALVALLLVAGCATAPRVRFSPEDAPVPVLFVHGTDSNVGEFLPMMRTFEAAGWAPERLYAVDLRPNNGQVPIEVMAYQVGYAAEGLRRRTRSERVDVVAFSQGALSARYWMQALGGQPHVRRFVSISGPHQGTWLAWLRADPALVQMRPGSDFLRELNQRPRYGDTEVFSFWTPWDGVVLPASSARLAGSTQQCFRVPFHPMMMTSPAVLAATVEVLAGPPAR